MALSRFALTISAAAALISACGGSQPPIGAPGTTAQSRAVAGPASSYRVLYSFRAGSDGMWPQGNLTDVNGTLYGTTWVGGGKGCIQSGPPYGCGTVFSITTSGNEKVLHSFSGPDGAFPTASLIDVNGTLYGTTYRGGAHNTCNTIGGGCGTVFSITTKGKVKVLYNFAGGPDGAQPSAAAGLIDVNGTLYGTTIYGGTYNRGTVFSISATGKEKVLYSFGLHDGWNPNSGLTDIRGTLYGTTSRGGGRHVFGTVFSITTGGAEHVLRSFNGYNGALPQGSLLGVKGTLYGTASDGGVRGAQNGTVFDIRKTGKRGLHVLHYFDQYSSGDDGRVPLAGLIEVNDKLYGTTWIGGSGGGTVFSLSTSGEERVLHIFGPGRAGVPDGLSPFGSLIGVNGTLYGTTTSGGSDDDGTVFALKP
ncbi:MAG: hypothetical protein JO113_03810 [Candidatus Eremiobacteraeota bacterium]|nr:hypothetical protein [Candidatus Eremiobacteraeota bacterium]